MTEKVIALRYFDGCPNWEAAKARLEEVLEQLGETRTLALQRVETPQQADELEFRRS